MYTGFEGCFIMLGEKCNAHCKYCLQTPLNNGSLPTELNPKVIDFLKNIIADFNSRDAHTKRNQDFFITFYGGEPLMYYDKIVDIVKRLEGVDTKFSIITNGILLDDEKVKFFNENNFNITLSWDGRYVEKTRLFDAVKLKKDVLFKIDRLMINGILTKHSYPLDIIEPIAEFNEEYNKVHNKGIDNMAVIGNIESYMDTGVCCDLNYVDGEKMYKQTYEMTMNMLEGKYKEDTPYNSVFNHFIGTVMHKMAESVDADCYPCGGCGDGWSILNVDLDGKLYACHNQRNPIADIFSSYANYFRAVVFAEQHVYDRVERKKCVDCVARHLCKGGCKMVTKEYEDNYCYIQKSYYGGFVNATIDYAKKQENEISRNSD